jgi:outer membrane protein OmpA-like peptidoglycan-associated protein
MGAALAVVALLAVVYWVAKPPSESVTVLPAPDGHIGTVVVQRGKEQQVLNQAYATSLSGKDEVVVLPADEVKQSFGDTLKALPAVPTVFMLYFITGTDELTDESKADLERILAELKNRPVPDVAVIGHTDTVGDLKGNDMLSLLRAETVKGFLVGIGIAADRITTAGRGKREPIVQTGDNIEEPKNRRVEINVR